MTELYHLDVFKHTKDTGAGGERMEGGGRNEDGWRKRWGEKERREGKRRGGRGRKWGERVIPFENPNTTLQMQSKDKLCSFPDAIRVCHPLQIQEPCVF